MGEALTSFMEDDECLFVTSSDFCHWESRFSYQLVYNKQVSIDQDMLGGRRLKYDERYTELHTNFSHFVMGRGKGEE